ncbi:hypothetical protein M569_02330, partial [Genlisea aurea]
RQILVKLLDGKHRIMNFYDSAVTGADLKKRIESLTFIPSGEQLLLIDSSKVLHDHQVLILPPSGKKPEEITLGCNFQLPRDKGFPDDESVIERDVLSNFPVVVHLLLRLRGGKGGFGSLLRGAATKAGHKKTNNFDACRDMNGRRLRHVNAEKKLEEWRAGAEERKLEKVAEDFLKKKSKEAVKIGKTAGVDSAEKYVAKYRADSEKCREVVEKAIRDSVK